MGFPFQVSDAELKKGAKKPEDSSEDENEEKEPSNELPKPKPPEGKPDECFETAMCEVPPMPDFCGLFDRALSSVLPQPAMSINININLGGDPCEQQPEPKPMKREPQVVSFLHGKDDDDATL